MVHVTRPTSLSDTSTRKLSHSTPGTTASTSQPQRDRETLDELVRFRSCSGERMFNSPTGESLRLLSMDASEGVSDLPDLIMFSTVAEREPSAGTLPSSPQSSHTDLHTVPARVPSDLVLPESATAASESASSSQCAGPEPDGVPNDSVMHANSALAAESPSASTSSRTRRFTRLANGIKFMHMHDTPSSVSSTAAPLRDGSQTPPSDGAAEDQANYNKGVLELERRMRRAGCRTPEQRRDHLATCKDLDADVRVQYLVRCPECLAPGLSWCEKGGDKFTKEWRSEADDPKAWGEEGKQWSSGMDLFSKPKPAAIKDGKDSATELEDGEIVQTNDGQATGSLDVDLIGPLDDILRYKESDLLPACVASWKELEAGKAQPTKLTGTKRKGSVVAQAVLEVARAARRRAKQLSSGSSSSSSTSSRRDNTNRSSNEGTGS